MSFYTILHGRNPLTSLFLGWLGLDQSDGKWPTGRFRDCWLEDGGKVLAVYTRNGGGNRDCWHEDAPECGSKACRHHVIQVEVDETREVRVGGGALVTYERTGRRVVEDRFVCEAPNSAECACPGCVVCHRLPQHPNYLSDADDDFDCTYATIRFRVPDEHAVEAGIIAVGQGQQKDGDTRWRDALDALQEAPKDEVLNDPKYAPIRDALTFVTKVTAP